MFNEQTGKSMKSWDEIFTMVHLARLMVETSHTDVCQQISKTCRDLHAQGEEPEQEDMEKWILILQKKMEE